MSVYVVYCHHNEPKEKDKSDVASICTSIQQRFSLRLTPFFSPLDSNTNDTGVSSSSSSSSRTTATTKSDYYLWNRPDIWIACAACKLQEQQCLRKYCEGNNNSSSKFAWKHFLSFHQLNSQSYHILYPHLIGGFIRREMKRIRVFRQLHKPVEAAWSSARRVITILQHMVKASANDASSSSSSSSSNPQAVKKEKKEVTVMQATETSKTEINDILNIERIELWLRSTPLSSEYADFYEILVAFQSELTDLLIDTIEYQHVQSRFFKPLEEKEKKITPIINSQADLQILNELFLLRATFHAQPSFLTPEIRQLFRWKMITTNIETMNRHHGPVEAKVTQTKNMESWMLTLWDDRWYRAQSVFRTPSWESIKLIKAQNDRASFWNPERKCYLEKRYTSRLSFGAMGAFESHLEMWTMQTQLEKDLPVKFSEDDIVQSPVYEPTLQTILQLLAADERFRDSVDLIWIGYHVPPSLRIVQMHSRTTRYFIKGAPPFEIGGMFGYIVPSKKSAQKLIDCFVQTQKPINVGVDTWIMKLNSTKLRQIHLNAPIVFSTYWMPDDIHTHKSDCGPAWNDFPLADRL